MTVTTTNHTITFDVKTNEKGEANKKRFAQIQFIFETDGKWHHHQTFFGTASNPYNYADFMFLRDVANEIERLKKELNHV